MLCFFDISPTAESQSILPLFSRSTEITVGCFAAISSIVLNFDLDCLLYTVFGFPVWSKEGGLKFIIIPKRVQSIFIINPMKFPQIVTPAIRANGVLLTLKCH